jgi:hypothetical protein
MGFKKPASEQQANYACGKCGEKFIKDKEIFMQKKEDGSWFSCHNLECFKSQGGTVEEKKPFGGNRFTSSKFPVGDVPQIFALAETILDSFKKKHNANENEKLTIGEELQAVESFFKSILTGCKP